MNISSMCATLATAGLTALPMAPADAARLPGIPKVQSVPISLDVAGYITVTSDWDATGPCILGEAYTLDEEYTFETGKPARTRLTRVKAPGIPASVTTTTLKPIGSATTTGRISGWRTSNYCSDPGPEPTPPACVTARGKLSITMNLASYHDSSEALTPLQGRTLMLGLMRSGGGSQSSDCPGGRRTSIEPVGLDYADTTIGTGSQSQLTDTILPTGIDSIKALSLKPGKSIRRTIQISGPCEAARVSTKAGAQTAADGACWVKGRVEVVLKRRG